MKESSFRYLLTAYVVMVPCCVAASFFSVDSFSAELAAAYANEPEAWLYQYTWIFISFMAAVILATVAGVVGLFLFKGWGRSLSLYSTIAAFLLYPLLGPTLYSPLEETLYEISSLLWGAILAMAYWSPFSHRFSADNSFKPDPLRESA